MRIIWLIILTTVGQQVFCQTFTRDYRRHKAEQISQGRALDSLRKSSDNDIYKLSKKQIRQAKNHWLHELDERVSEFDRMFQAYQNQVGFDFNTAPQLTIVYQTNVQTALSRYIVISGRDTMSFAEKWKPGGNRLLGKDIATEPFVHPADVRGYVIIDERDSLVTLAMQRDFKTAIKMANEHATINAPTSYIIVATMQGGHYTFEEISLPPFMIAPIWRNRWESWEKPYQ